MTSSMTVYGYYQSGNFWQFISKYFFSEDAVEAKVSFFCFNFIGPNNDYVFHSDSSHDCNSIFP